VKAATMGGAAAERKGNRTGAGSIEGRGGKQGERETRDRSMCNKKKNLTRIKRRAGKKPGRRKCKHGQKKKQRQNSFIEGRGASTFDEHRSGPNGKGNTNKTRNQKHPGWARPSDGFYI